MPTFGDNGERRHKATTVSSYSNTNFFVRKVGPIERCKPPVAPRYAAEGICGRSIGGVT
jgi:hypothetical protein